MDIIMGGFIATILNMDANLEKLVNNNRSDSSSLNLDKDNLSNNEDLKNDVGKTIPQVPLSNNQIKIIRLKSVVGSALLVDVKLDDQHFKLENGETKLFDVENGKHTISATFDNDYEKLEFEINNNSKVINVFIKPPIKIQEV
jgi:hypothetical protein